MGRVWCLVICAKIRQRFHIGCSSQIHFTQRYNHTLHILIQLHTYHIMHSGLGITLRMRVMQLAHLPLIHPLVMQHRDRAQGCLDSDSTTAGYDHSPSAQAAPIVTSCSRSPEPPTSYGIPATFHLLQLPSALASIVRSNSSYSLPILYHFAVSLGPPVRSCCLSLGCT